MSGRGAQDVVIVGGGVIGLAIARDLAATGRSVRLLEKSEPGSEASGASAGMLAAQIEAHQASPLLALALRSRDLYPAFLRDLEEETGIGVDLRTEGALVVGRSEEERRTLDREAQAQQALGLPVAWLERDALLRKEPVLSEDLCGGFHLPREHSLDPVRLTRALRRSAEAKGAVIASRTEATRIEANPGGRPAVLTAGGECHAADAVVLAAGAWSSAVAAAGFTPPPAEPVRGQIVCFRAPDLLSHIVIGTDAYLVPRGDGRIVVGSTMERAGFDRSVTAEGLLRLTSAALALVPPLRGRPFSGAWAGLRPGSPDGLPILGCLADGVYAACGHLRLGVTLAPITARLVTALIAGTEPGIDLTPFRPERFGAPAVTSSAPPPSAAGRARPENRP
jgi:glycine oxidase